MATVTTDSGFYWYLRAGPKVNTIGIINEDGGAVDSGLTVELHTELADDTGDWSDDAEFLVPDRHLLQFVKGVIDEYMSIVHGQSDPRFVAEYESAKAKLRGLIRVQKHGSDHMKPKNLRGDSRNYTFVRSENE